MPSPPAFQSPAATAPTVFRWACILVGLLVLSGCNRMTAPAGPPAEKGVLDLREWDLEKQGPVSLTGEWRFYWKRLMDPGDFAGPDTPAKGAFRRADGSPSFLRVPGNWTDLKTGIADPGGKPQTLGADGFATMRLRVLNRPAKGTLAMKLTSVAQAYKIWADDKLIVESGFVSANPGEHRPTYKPRVVHFKPPGPNFTITMQVSVYDRGEGGVGPGMVLGTPERVENIGYWKLVYDMALLGALLIMGFHHLGHFILRRKDTSALFLSLFAFMIAFRMVLSGETLILRIFPDLNYFVFVRVLFLSAFVAAPMYMVFTHTLYPVELPRRYVYIFLGIAGLFISTVFLPVRFMILTVEPWILMLLLGFVYILYVLITATLKGRDGARIALVGNLFFFVTVLHDMLLNSYRVDQIFLHPLGLFIFIVSHSFLLSGRYNRAIVRAQGLSRRLLSLDRLKDEFLANTSHELRTPLHGMIGLAETLQEGIAGELPEQARRSLDMIVSSGRRLSSMVNDILDFSRMKNQDLELEPQLVDLSSMADVALRLCEPLLGKKPVRLIKNIPRDLPPVLADENRLQQILYNLLGNAVKFTHEGFVTLSARRESETGESENIRIAVSDTGIGIPEDKQRTIFNSFEQSDGSPERAYGGTGLGLSITRRLVEMHDSRLDLISIPGRGSQFFFLLPAAPAMNASTGERLSTAAAALLARKTRRDKRRKKKTEDREVPMPAPGRKRFKHLKEPTILIVDDEPVNLEILRGHLKLHGYRVLSAQDGREALAVISRESVDLAVLDLMMPRMSGYELCRRIRLNHDLLRLPIIMLTARNTVDDLVRSLDSGANDFLTKPFNRSELLTRIDLNLNFKENLLLMEEVARRKQAEEDLVEMNISKDRFLSIISHDLLTPFAGFMTLLEHLRDNYESLERDEVLRMVERAGDTGSRLFELMNNLLDWARMQMGRMPVRTENLSVPELAEGNRQLFAFTAEQKGVILRSLAEPGEIRGDRLMVDTILRNLLSNALKFSREGDTVEIESHREGEYMEIAVRDTGIGMDPETRESLFRLDSVRSRPGTAGESGGGLGLILCRELAEKMNGRIRVESDEGGGSRFALILPAGVGAESPLAGRG